MTFARRYPFILLLAVCAFAALGTASAQVRVDLALNRSQFIRYEPLVAIVTITNVSGGDLELSDDGNHKWFSFHIEHPTQDDGDGDAIVPPNDPDYSLAPITIGAGESIKRAVNVTPLYPLTEFGTYRLRATVYDAKSGGYYSSDPLNVEITEGQSLWSQTVGVPETAASPDGAPGSGKSARTITLLSHRLPSDTQLYLRIEDKDKGLIYCTAQLGRVVSFGKPEIQLGPNNDVHVLQAVAPRMFLYTRMDVSGKVLARKQYQGNELTRPTLRRDTAGGIQVFGGIPVDQNAVAAAEKKSGPPPSVDARPVPLPKSE